MTNLKVVLNSAGIKQMMKSQEMQNICTELAYSAKAKLGEGYEVTYRKGKTRVNASIGAVTPEAIQDNLENNTLLKSLGGKL